MKKIITGLMIAFLFIGCGSKGAVEQNVEAKLVVGKSLVNLGLNDQFGKPVTLKAETKKIVISFSKDAGHICSAFFEKQSESYLENNKIQYVADISPAPSLIRSLFVIPGLKDIKYPILILDDEKIAAPFRAGIDVEKTIVVSLNNNSITEIKAVNSEDELKKALEAK
ncbi:MAG: hypothetical protein U9O83_03540 [Campylobacterota bacterium]|nr:hypothetical protein [Campylobacterota bacterium]